MPRRNVAWVITINAASVTWPAKAVDVYRNGRKVETLKGDRITLKTEAGATTLLGPEGAAPPVEK